MRVFDDKSSCVYKTDKYIVFSEINENEDITFKASSIVSAELICSRKVTALFDLVVFGDIEAYDLDVKGKLICTGECNIKNQLIVQNDIWSNEIYAEEIVSHNQINALSIDSKRVTADGNIIVGKTLSIEELAKTDNVLICGETAYGAGKVMANAVLTAEPLDLDDGIDAVMEPNEYVPSPKEDDMQDNLVLLGIRDYEPQNDYEGYLSFLIKTVDSKKDQLRFNEWLHYLYLIDSSYDKNFADCYDSIWLIKLLEIYSSLYFSEWSVLQEWINALVKRFEFLLRGTEKEYKLIECHTMNVGDEVLHKKYGRGKVKKVVHDLNTRYVDIEFYLDTPGSVKKFPIPDAFKFFQTVQETEKDNSIQYEKIKCTVNSYSEWLNGLSIIDENRKILPEVLYSALFDRLIAYVGLKAKYLTDRFKEKGWE